MKRKPYIIAAMLLITGAAYAGQRSVNAYKAVKLSTTSVLVYCNDEREPVVTRLKDTAYIIVTCTEVK